MPNAQFDRATFIGDARFDKPKESKVYPFRGVTFAGNARFREATFAGNARFREATFAEVAGFDAVSLSGGLLFLRVRAAKRLWLALRDGSMGEVDLTEASFAGPAVLTASLGVPAFGDRSWSR